MSRLPDATSTRTVAPRSRPERRAGVVVREDPLEAEPVQRVAVSTPLAQPEPVPPAVAGNRERRSPQASSSRGWSVAAAVGTVAVGERRPRTARARRHRRAAARTRRAAPRNDSSPGTVAEPAAGTGGCARSPYICRAPPPLGAEPRRVLLRVVRAVVARLDRLPPVAVVAIPRDRLLEAAGVERVPRRPAEPAELRRVDGVAAVVTRAGRPRGGRGRARPRSGRGSGARPPGSRAPGRRRCRPRRRRRSAARARSPRSDPRRAATRGAGGRRRTRAAAGGRTRS